MKHISILALNNARLSSIEIPRHAFSEVNNFLISQNKQPLFEVEFVGLSKKIILNNGLYVITPHKLIEDVKKTDLIIVPALEDDLEKNLPLNTGFIPWIVKQYKGGAEVASLCVGAFLLASTGLLNGKHCSTHWRAANEFREMFPQVNLTIDKVITDEQGTYSSGGAFSSSNLILYLIEKYVGRDVAIHCSKLFQVDTERDSQSPFMIFKGQKTHDDDAIKNVQEFIENNFREKITVDQLSERFQIGRRTFERRFKKATFNSIVEYIQRVKVEAAKKQLEAGRKTVSEVMYDVGYTDTK
ncbi:MAG: helix-turn-helix domain-containing protein, partial [Bacteroidetes bacterium]|nr:helix-turn-helix domain-containing protein [Bacteroidota bacterium]